jgi:hypothetical protein
VPRNICSVLCSNMYNHNTYTETFSLSLSLSLSLTHSHTHTHTHTHTHSRASFATEIELGPSEIWYLFVDTYVNGKLEKHPWNIGAKDTFQVATKLLTKPLSNLSLAKQISNLFSTKPISLEYRHERTFLVAS